MIDMRAWEEIAAKNIHNRPSVPGRLKGKIAVITGAAQGFGQGIAEEMYKEGAAVVIADINLPLAQEVAAALGERAAAVQVNVADEENVAQMVQKTVAVVGYDEETVSFRIGSKKTPLVLPLADVLSCDYARGDHGEE